jgi:hypothetical protein
MFGAAPQGALALPQQLLPFDNGRGDGGRRASWSNLGPLPARPGTPPGVVAACRSALASAATPYGAVQVDVASAGRASRLRNGGLSAPVKARVIYVRNGRMQVRQAGVTCRLDDQGRVVATL